MKDQRVRQLKYDQVRLAIIKLIGDGGFEIGDKLPPMRFMLNSLSCSMITLRRALDDLAASGLIRKKHGSGIYLAEKVCNEKSPNFLLYINVHREGDLTSGVGMGRLRFYLAERGIGLRSISVHDFSVAVTNAASEGCLGVLTAGWLTDKFIEQLQKLNLPLVVLGNNALKVAVPQVSINAEAAANQMTQIMLQDGRKKVALVRGGANYFMGQLEEKGYRRAMSEAGLEPLVMFSVDDKYYYDEFSRFMAQHSDVEGLLLELTAFADFSAWCWEHDYARHPAVAILGSLNLQHRYRQSRKFMWLNFENIALCGGKMLLDHIVNNQELRSILLAPQNLPETTGICFFES